MAPVQCTAGILSHGIIPREMLAFQVGLASLLHLYEQALRMGLPARPAFHDWFAFLLEDCMRLTGAIARPDREFIELDRVSDVDIQNFETDLNLATDDLKLAVEDNGALAQCLASVPLRGQ